MLKIFVCIYFLISNLVWANSVSIMSYNVENLFDTVHDTNKEDWAFLPKDAPLKNETCMKESSKKRRSECMDSDWTKQKLEWKLEHITDVVKSARPMLPDFLGVVEIENPNVASMLASKLGYQKFEMSDSPDKRGVDVALFYKENSQIQKIARNELIVPTEYSTRNILEVRFKIGNEVYLTIFVNHWPSLHNPDADRVKAAEVLRKRVAEVVKNNPEERIVALGDFNTVDSNNPHPFKTVLYVDNLLSDLYDSVMADKKIAESHKKNLGSGTYYFAPQDSWNFLDHFFVNKVILTDKLSIETLNSFQIYSNPKMQKEIQKFINEDKEKGMKIILAPKKFNPDAKNIDSIGYSDHFPIIMNLHFSDVPKEKPIKQKKAISKKKL